MTYYISGLVWGLLESASDNNLDVRETVMASLCVLGDSHPSLVLDIIHKFISSPQTAPRVCLYLFKNSYYFFIKKSFTYSMII